MYATISPAELAEALRQGNPNLIDVRTPAEFREVHVRGARNVPLDRLQPADFKTHDGHLYVICQKGSRGAKACDQLAAAGVGDLSNVAGGTEACESAGLPFERGRKSMSLERQVRIAAGSLVVIGTALGAFVHPAWLGLAGFVGAGLVFAGVTDTCAMGMLIARMPWNQTQ
ncbi:Inner membrane protein YgaP [Botrimarina colliarenosi]|uniref:Inner membrane protein YgaP n=1 Tax=Botrimarina colliarenosi TaxID=2528001 RepID=A0A5C6AP94_9BACT|nr:rhodanese-like domain-containing protein [Botrimarina colliarenosi]TWT99993.1 Inner membrane protein YgaP [Botrimarina colliarenosi]